MSKSHPQLPQFDQVQVLVHNQHPQSALNFPSPPKNDTINECQLNLNSILNEMGTIKGDLQALEL
jgi:hypothetical protein